MIRSLRTGVSGLKTHQERMNVVGNNITNANTVAFKKRRANFSDVMGQQLIGVSKTMGGQAINPAYVGNGVAIGSINMNWNQGGLDYTSVPTDVAIKGDGFMIVRRGQRNLLTRAGNFSFNRDGQFVTPTGLNVQGFAIDQTTGDVDMTRMQDIQMDWAATSAPKHTESATVTGNLSADAADTDTIDMSTVVYNAQGEPRSVVITFTKTAIADEWSYTIDDAAGAAFTASATGTITFDTTGGTATGDTTATLTWQTAEAPAASNTFAIDLTALTQYSGSSTALVREQDGYSAGKLASYAFEPDGRLMLNFTNGESRPIFQLALGQVNNMNGLDHLGDNFFAPNFASGDLVIGRAAQEFESSIIAGALEQSNVDIAEEFTDMIVTQRGYQASARVITTSDEILQETLGLKR